MAELPLMLKAATSCALAAISGVGNVPSHMRDFLRGSRISETHFPQFRMRTPRYTGCLLESRMRFIFLESGSSPLACGTESEFFTALPLLEDGVGEDGEVGGDENEFELLSVSEFWGSTLIFNDCWEVKWRCFSYFFLFW